MPPFKTRRRISVTRSVSFYLLLIFIGSYSTIEEKRQLNMLRYSEDKEIDKSQLEALFLSVGWESGRVPDRLQRAIRGYDTVISAWEGERLLGLIAAMDDGEMTASYLLTSRRATVDLSNSSRFRLEEGDYIIRIRALARMQNTSDSEWSQPYEFHKEYETGCTYVLVNNGTEYEISRAGRATGDIVIEEIYRGKPVTGIADGAFRNVSRITGIVLGANVKRIGANAFNGCANLTSVTLPEGLETIDNAAFRGCENLTEIVIPDSVLQKPYFDYYRRRSGNA